MAHTLVQDITRRPKLKIPIDFNARRGIQQIYQILPGKKCLLDVSSRFPQDIIDLYAKDIDDHETIMFYNDDVWRYSNDPVLLDFYRSHPQKQFYIQHLGHANRWLTNNAREFSIPFLIETDLEVQGNPLHAAQYGFASLNNRPSYARLLLGYHLHRAGVLSQMVFTQNINIENPAEPILGGYTRSLLDELPGIDEYFARLPIRWRDEVIDKTPDNLIPNVHHNTFRFWNHEAYENAWCLITTETETEWWGIDQSYPTPIATEKTFKPFLSCQIGLWLVAQGHFAWLRNHGMVPYEDLVGSDYDNKNTIEKIKTIVEIVKLGREFMSNFYVSHLREIVHNQQHVLTGAFERSIITAATKLVQE